VTPVPYVFLNPDGIEDLGLHVIVESPTGVVYAHQCAGSLTEIRTVEGFLIPVGGPDAARRIYDWFWATFGGTCYGPVEWTGDRIDPLADLVAQIACWLTHPDGAGDERRTLELDRERIGECVEAWIPVRTPYGRGILVLKNSD
jgi:hypothetical protein